MEPMNPLYHMTTTTYPNIIGLYAPALGSGKTVVASHLCSEYGYTVVKFTTVMKNMVRVFLKGMAFSNDVVERMINGDLKEKAIPGLENLNGMTGLFDITPRHVMQTIGTEWGRHCIKDDIWVHTALKSAARSTAAGGLVVFDDLRFPNEYEALDKQGAAFVKVIRPGVKAPTDHPSEGLLDDHRFDVQITNDETIRVLVQAVDMMMAGIQEHLS